MHTQHSWQTLAQKGWFRSAVLALGLAASGLAQAVPDDILGYWRVIDDRTGFAKAIAFFNKNADGYYVGRIMSTIPRPDYTPITVCQKCPPPFTNRKVIGMPVAWFKANPTAIEGKTWEYTQGHALDPIQGRIYQGKAKISPDRRRLTMRGYLGVSLLGRTQTWIREDAGSPLLKNLPSVEEAEKEQVELPKF